MSLDEWMQPTVDPEVRAYVGSLVSAVGGISIEEHGRYVLGDDALGCLKDLKRWIRFYDQKLNRLDVQRVLAESNLLKGDLLEILAGWKDEQQDHKFKFKVALACLELLTPLTWPYDVEDAKVTKNHHRHLPYLRLAQVEYKRAILHHDTAKILKATARIALPSLGVARNDRTPRDDGIIRLALYFFRNIAMLSQPKDLPADVDEAEISRSTTIDAFHSQLVLDVLLTISSGMGEQFILQDVVVLETLFYLLKGIDPEKLFMDDVQIKTVKNDELRDLMQKERSQQAGSKRYAPSRHNRFGTMVWLKRDDEKMTTMTGQSAISGPDRGVVQMDKTKKWNKPKQRGRRPDDDPMAEFNLSVPLTASARRHLCRFIANFLDSAFNPLFTHLRRSIERELERVQEEHKMQFFYLISWFLEAECARRRADKQSQSLMQTGAAAPSEGPRDEGFAYVASVLNQETFILLSRHMERSLDQKDWKALDAQMKCFIQILLTVQEMSESPSEEDLEIAENIQSRLFYEESTHDRIIRILREYKDQGFGYLDTCTELAHVFIRIVERYSKQNSDMLVRSKRRARRKRKAGSDKSGDAAAPNAESEEDDHQEAEITSRERKFDFARFQARFMTQAIVDTFVSLLKFYNDLSVEQLKRIHRFLYRVAFKNEFAVVLYRVDVIALLHKIVKGPEGLPADNPVYKEWEEFGRQLFKRMLKKLQQRPELMVEMLFSKIPSTMYYLEYGHDKEVPKKATRPAAELELRPGINPQKGIGAVIGLLTSDDNGNLVKWVKDELERGFTDRQAWADMHAARVTIGDVSAKDEAHTPPAIVVRPGSAEIKKATFKNGRLRLLMDIVGFERLGAVDDPDTSYIIPSQVTADQLKEAFANVCAFLDHEQEYDDTREHIDFIRRKPNALAVRESSHGGLFFDDDDEDAVGSVDEDFLFPAGGPTARKSDVIKGLKQRRLKRTRRAEGDEVSDEKRAEKAEAKRQAELEKRRQIKSELFVRESDDDTDEERDQEFFRQEEERRNKSKADISRAIARLSREDQEPKTKKRKPRADGDLRAKKRRKSASMDGGEHGEESQQNNVAVSISSDSSSSLSSDSEEEIMSGLEDKDTPMSSQHQASHDEETASATANSKALSAAVPRDVDMAGAEDEDEDDGPVVRKVTGRRAGFLVDSDSE